MDIEKHIVKLLLSNDCVIVPDFGGFMAHHLDAYYDEGDKRFYPPRRMIGFNPQLMMNDSLLAQSLVEACDMSYPEAMSAIERDVCELRHILETRGEYAISGIGVLILTADGKYDFKPCDAGLLTPSLYGLDVLDVQKVGCGALELQLPLDETEEIAEEKETLPKTKYFPMWLLRDVAAACIAIAVFLLVPKNNSVRNDASTTASEASASMLMGVMPQAASTATSKPAILTLRDKVDNEKENISAPDTTVSRQEKVAEQKRQGYFTIVLASRVSRKGAEAYVRQLNGEGYRDVSIEGAGTTMKVVYGKFDSKEKAQKCLRQLTDRQEFADCWVKFID